MRRTHQGIVSRHIPVILRMKKKCDNHQTSPNFENFSNWQVIGILGLVTHQSTSEAARVL